MSAPFAPACRSARSAGLAAALALAVAGCGFHLAGTVRHLPAAMAHTCIQSEEPYGHLENLLRNAIRAHGDEVSDSCGKDAATLAIISHSVETRVLAVNSQGQPLQYQLTYQVQFRLDGADGKTLLPAASLQLQRQLAYSVYNELGTGRRKKALIADMQREASRLILLRLEALDRRPSPAAKS